MFITPFASARHLSLSCRSFLILPSHLFLGLPNGLFHSGYPTKTHYTLLLFPIQATCPAQHIFLDFMNRKILSEKYRSSCSLRSFLHSPVNSSHLGPYILRFPECEFSSMCRNIHKDLVS